MVANKRHLNFEELSGTYATAVEENYKEIKDAYRSISKQTKESQILC